MEDKHSYFLLSLARSIATSVKFSSELTTNTVVAGLFNTLTTQNITANKMAMDLETSTKIYTKESDAVRDKSAQEISIAAQVASGFGAGNDNTDLKDLKRFTYWELRKSTLKQQITDSKMIMALIGTNATDLDGAGIDAALITSLNNGVTKMESLTAIPQNMIDLHKNNKILFEDFLDGIKKILDEQLDKAMLIYKLKNMAFYLAYLAARRVRHHHLKRKPKVIDPETLTGILELMVLYKDTLDPAAGVSLVVQLLSISETTDEDGETYNDELKPGTYHGKLTMDGYKDVEFDFTIEAGKTCSLQFLMEKADVAPSGTPVS